MPDPVHAWAAMAPDGRMDFWSMHPERDGARFYVAQRFMGKSYGSAEAGWQKAQDAGWRVVRVKIEVEDGDAG